MRSLKQQILLLVAAMVLATIVASSLVAAFDIQRTLRQSALRQTEAVASRIASILESGAADALNQAASARALLTTERDPRARRAALSSLVAADPDLIGAAVWRPDSAARLFVNGPAADSTPVAFRIPKARPDSIAVGPIRASGGFHFFDITLPIDTAANRREHLVVRRRLGAREVRQMVAELGGTAAVLLIGTNDDQWSDLSQTVPAPNAETRTRYRWKGDSTFDGVKVRIAGTPWQLWVGVPRASFAAPTRTVVMNIMAAGLGILAVSTLFAYFLARRIIAPLDSIRSAMLQIADGQHRLRVPEHGPAEILALSEAVNSMADRLEEGADRFEHIVEQRTGELESALAELRSTQEQLVRTERLATIGRLADVVGGELRAPLRAMSSAIYYLEMMSHKASQAVKENYAILRYQILIAEKIVADLLDFSRTQPPQKQQTEIRELLDEQISRLGKPSGISIVREYHPATPAALIDPIQIGKAILNVLTDAVQAMNGGGTVTVRAQPGEGVVNIIIEDTGPGIAAEDLPHVFEPLFTKRSHSIGLGLAVARGLIEENGGTISITSEPGSGARFQIRLPLA